MQLQLVNITGWLERRITLERPNISITVDTINPICDRTRANDKDLTQTSRLYRLDNSDHQELYELAVLMVYEGGLSFTFFEQPAVQNFLHRLNSVYKPPSAFVLRESLLDNSYERVKEEVDETIDKEDSLNVCFDGSGDIARHRILNISIHPTRSAFFHENLVVPIVIYSLAIEIYRKFHICFMRHFFHFREINFISIPRDVSGAQLRLQFRPRRNFGAKP